MKLSPHFSLAELTATSTGIDNTPNQEQLARLANTAKCMEAVRAAVGNRPIRISSGFRSAAVNKKVGGSDVSAHKDGDAVDFIVSGLCNKDICEAILAAGIQFDQLIDEERNNRRWIHISFSKLMRGQYMLYRNGKYQLLEKKL